MAAPGRLSIIVLAAGRSRRMGSVNKLLKDVSGKAMIVQVVETAIAARLGDVVVVTGHQAGDVERALSGLPVRIVHNRHYASGMASSLKVGIASVERQCDGAVVMLGDMPDVPVEVVEDLAREFDGPGDICVPVHSGRRGNPVLWGADYFADIAQLDGDRGAKMLLALFSDKVKEVPVASAAIFVDYDSPESFEKGDHESK